MGVNFATCKNLKIIKSPFFPQKYLSQNKNLLLDFFSIANGTLSTLTNDNSLLYQLFQNRKRGFRTLKKLLKCQTKKFRCRKRGHSNKLFYKNTSQYLLSIALHPLFLWNMELTALERWRPSFLHSWSIHHTCKYGFYCFCKTVVQSALKFYR